MGGVPVKHHSKGKVGRRRSHLALKKTKLMVCPQCSGPRVPHRSCPQCGFHQVRKNTKAAVLTT